MAALGGARPGEVGVADKSLVECPRAFPFLRSSSGSRGFPRDLIQDFKSDITSNWLEVREEQWLQDRMRFALPPMDVRDPGGYSLPLVIAGKGGAPGP